MRIVLFAWCPTTPVHLEALAASGAAPALVVSGGRAATARALERACADGGVPFERCDDVSSPGFVARVERLAPDLLVVAGCPQILRAPLRRAFRLGAVNLHPSLLPAYRGREPLFWAILHGEPKVGVTAHHLTDAVDAGPILLAREIPVPPRATSASLAAEVDRAGAALLPELVAMARGGALPEGARPRGPGSRFPPLREEHGRIDWRRPAAAIDRLVRACAGEIAAHAFFQGMKIVVLDGEPVPSPRPRAPPGEVLAVEEGAVLVAAGEGAFAARALVFLHRRRRAGELAAELGIFPGARLSGEPEGGDP